MWLLNMGILHCQAKVNIVSIELCKFTKSLQYCQPILGGSSGNAPEVIPKDICSPGLFGIVSLVWCRHVYSPQGAKLLWPYPLANMGVEILNNPHLSNMLTGKSHVNRGIVCWLPGEPMRHGPVSQDSKTAKASSQRPPFPQALIKALKVMTSASSCSLSRERNSLKYNFGGAATPQRGCSHPNVRGGKRPKKEVTKYIPHRHMSTLGGHDLPIIGWGDSTSSWSSFPDHPK